MVSMNNLCNPQGIRSVLMKTGIMILVHIMTSVTLIYILGLHETRMSQSPLPQRGQVSYNTPRFYKNV